MSPQRIYTRAVNLADAIGAIRVVRQFSAETIDDHTIERIVNAGRRAGSSKNLQRWDFVVVRDPARREQLAGAGDFAQHVAGAAAVIALVTPDPHAPDAPLSIIFDLGRAAQNMVLTAWDLGIGSCPATVYEQDLVKEILGIPDDRHCEYLLSFGYPADVRTLTERPRRGGRRDFAEMVHRERWGS